MLSLVVEYYKEGQPSDLYPVPCSDGIKQHLLVLL